jgi:hypothetical protein
MAQAYLEFVGGQTVSDVILPLPQRLGIQPSDQYKSETLDRIEQSINSLRKRLDSNSLNQRLLLQCGQLSFVEKWSVSSQDYIDMFGKSSGDGETVLAKIDTLVQEQRDLYVFTTIIATFGMVLKGVADGKLLRPATAKDRTKRHRVWLKLT